VVAAPVPAAPAVTLSSSEGDYVLTPGDTIEMSVFREPDLAARATIGRDGTVQLPLIREVSLAGKTIRDARTFLTKLYGEKYLVNPQIYLSVAVFAQRKFTIMGQVARAGSYELQGGQSLGLLEAIGLAGGFTRIADRGRVIVRRKDPDDGTIEAFKLNAKKMAEGRAERFEILPGDIVTVGESWY
jgi:polysaccharide export outer membrane protein